MEKNERFIRLTKLVEEVKEDMRKADIPFDETVPFVINNRLTKALGRCSYNKVFGATKIEIAGVVMECSNDAKIKNVICHELIHSARNCLGCGHRGMWKIYANNMNWKDRRYNIETVTYDFLSKELDEEKMKKINSKYKFKIQCKKCNASQSYTRETKAVKVMKEGLGNLLICHQCKSNDFELIELKNN